MKNAKKAPETSEIQGTLVIAVILAVLVGVLTAIPSIRHTGWLPVALIPLVGVIGALIGYSIIPKRNKKK